MPEVVTHVDPNPKRPGTGAFVRYGAYALGRTRDDLLAGGLTKRDLSWDEAQGHVRFGEGERTGAPITSVTAVPSVPQPRSKKKGPPAPSAPTLEPGLPTIVLPSLALPAGRIVGAIEGPPRLAADWWLPAREVVGEAGPGDQSRTWTITATTARGRVLTRTEAGDRSARHRVDQVVVAGLDPDDWRAA